MGFWTWIKEMLFGCKLVYVGDVEDIVRDALAMADKDKDEMISVGELVDFIKEVLKRY